MVSFTSFICAGLAVTGAVAAPHLQHMKLHETRGTTSGKRGLAFNDYSLTSSFSSSSSFSWAYNWVSAIQGTTLPLSNDIEFVPMLWGPKFYSVWDAEAEVALAGGSTHLLAFNEPDLPAQANLSPSQAASDYQTYMNKYSDRAQLGSPSVTNGADGMGLSWLSSFFSSCGGNCKVDFINIHWYDSASNTAYFKQHVADAITLAKNNKVEKVWITEFGASGSDEEVAQFLDEIIPWLDSQAEVERYAYFMCSEGVLLSGNSVSTVGKAYLSA